MYTTVKDFVKQACNFGKKKNRCARNDYFLKLTKPTLVIIVDEPLTEEQGNCQRQNATWASVKYWSI